MDVGQHKPVSLGELAMAIGRNDDQVKASLLFWLYVTTRSNTINWDQTAATLTPTDWNPAQANLAALNGTGHGGNVQRILKKIAANRNGEWDHLRAVQGLFSELMTDPTIFTDAATGLPPYVPTGGHTCPGSVDYLNQLILTYP